MNPQLIDLAAEGVATAPGTGSTISLNGIAQPAGLNSSGISAGLSNSGPLTWAAAGAINGTTYRYKIIDGDNVEICTGVYTASSNSLSRNTVVAVVGTVKQLTPINASSGAVICSTAIASDIMTPVGISMSAGGMVNKFRNGTFDIWQRGYGPYTMTTVGGYTADGWQIAPFGASVTVQKAAGRKLTINSLQITGAAGVTDCVALQRIESHDAAPLNGQIVTVQAQIYNGTGAAFSPSLNVAHATVADNFTTTASDLTGVNLQSCANGAWTQVNYTFTDAGFATQGLQIAFDFGANLNGAGKYICITECDIRATPLMSATNTTANTPPIPELRPISEELRLCRRHFRSTYVNGTMPATATTDGAIYEPCAPIQVTGGSYYVAVGVEYDAMMRVTPSLTFYDRNGNPGAYSIYNPASSSWLDNQTIPTLFISHHGGFGFNAPTIFPAPGSAIACHYLASAEL